MRVEHLLLAGVVALVFVGAVVAAVAPGVFDEEDPPGAAQIMVEEVDVEPGEVTGGSAEIVTVSRLWSTDTVDGDVSVVVRARSTDTGLLEDESTHELEEIVGGEETEIRVPVEVERSGSYEFDVVVYTDGERASERSVRISGVESLTPEHMDSDVEFHDFYILPSMEFSIAEAGDHVELDVTSYLSNAGDTVESVDLMVKARQAESNILADETQTAASVSPTETEAVDTTLSVPDGYNYYLDAEIWSDGNVVATHRITANLDPTREVEANVTERDVGLEVEEFEDEEQRFREERRELEEQLDGEPEEATPGFGVFAAAAALLLSTLVLRRRRGGLR